MIAVATGWAVRLPLGATVEEVATRLLAGERAAAPGVGLQGGAGLGARIRGEPTATRHRRFVPRMGLFGIEVALEALAQSGRTGGERLGLFAGVGGLRVDWSATMGALEGQEPGGASSWDRGLKALHPFWLLRHLSNNAHALLSSEIGARGEGLTFGGANAGTQALAAAVRSLAAGAVDAAVVLAYDSLLEPEAVLELTARGAAATSELDALRPAYDRGASGLVPGEGAAAIVLEPEAGAGSRALARLDAADAADGASGEPKAATVARAVRAVARRDALVDGAGVGLPEHDRAEREALAAVLGPDALLTTTAAAFGHLGAAMSVAQAVVLATCLRLGRAPPIAGLRDPAAGPLRPLVRAESTGARSAIGVCVGAPGLAGAVRVEVA